MQVDLEKDMQSGQLVRGGKKASFASETRDRGDFGV